MNLRFDRCVIGGGIDAVLVAVLLQQEGKTVAVLDDADYESRLRESTTAHFMNLMDLSFAELETHETRFEVKHAIREHLSALANLEQVIDDESIDCGFRRVDGFMYLSAKDSESVLEKELRALARSGLHGVRRVDNIPSLPFKSGRSLFFPKQIQIHTRKLYLKLMELFLKNGGAVHSRIPIAFTHEGRPPYVITDNGLRVDCHEVISVSPRRKLFQNTNAIGAIIPKNTVPRCLYRDTHQPPHYFRVQAHPKHTNFDILIVQGDTLIKLENWARTHFPQIKTIVDYGEEFETINA